MFQTYLYQPILSLLLFIDQGVGNLGLAIIILTLLIRLVLLPLTIPSLKAAGKIQALQPEINALKKKYKDDKAGLQQAQLELFQEHKVNPAAGCLPQILQIIVFIALYRVFIDFLQNNTTAISTHQLFWFDVTTTDPLHILPILAGFTQLILSLMIMPAADANAEQAIAATTEDTKDDKDAQDMSAMAQTMQQQMMLFMPVMTAVIAFQFPAGLAVYWITSTVFSIAQQYWVSGWGGLGHRLQKWLPTGNK